MRFVLKTNISCFLKILEKLIYNVLRDLVSVNIWRLYDRSNACECMLTLFSTFVSFLSACMS